jgi:hypothetical protein
MNSGADWPVACPPIAGIVSERPPAFHDPRFALFALLPSPDDLLAIDYPATWRILESFWDWGLN